MIVTFLDANKESFVFSMDNLGRIGIYSLPIIHREALITCIDPSDITGISSFLFCPSARLFYLKSASEIAELTMDPRYRSPYSMALDCDQIHRKVVQRTESNRTSLPTNVISSIHNGTVKEVDPNEILSNTTQNMDMVNKIDNKNPFLDSER